jgi:hypothetical protein
MELQKVDIAKIQSYLRSLGFIVLDHFPTSGGPIFVLGDHTQVKQILCQHCLKINSLPGELLVTHARQIEIDNAFKTAIMGISSYEGIIPHLIVWIASICAKNPDWFFVDSRVPPNEPDAFVFHMSCWKATQHVLQSAASFTDTFYPKYKKLMAPQLVWDINNNGTWRASFGEVIAAGGETVNAAITSLNNKFDNLVQETRTQGTAIQGQMTTMASNFASLSSTVSSMGMQLHNNQHALLQSNRDGALRSQLSMVQL